MTALGVMLVVAQGVTIEDAWRHAMRQALSPYRAVAWDDSDDVLRWLLVGLRRAS